MTRIVELALYGIRQFQSLTRIPFGPGFNLLAGGTGTGKSTIWELLVALLVPERAGTFRPFLHPHHTERAQAALIIQSENGTWYRLVRDFAHERIHLFKLEHPGQTSPTTAPPIATDGPSVKAELTKLFHGLTAEEISLRWLLSRTQLPSAVSGSVNGPAPSTLSRSEPPAQPAPSAQPSAPSAANRARLEELKRALAKAEEVAALEEKVIVAQDRAAAIKHKMTMVAQLNDELAATQAQAEGCTGFAQLPADYPVLIEGLVERERALQAQQDNLQEQLNTLEEERSALPSEPIFRQRWFLVGAGLTGLALLVALFVNLPGQFKLVFPGLLAAGLGILSWSIFSDMRTQNQRKQLDLKTKALKMEQETAEKRFAREQRPALDLLTQTGSDDVTMFHEKARTYRRLLDEIDRLQEERARYLEGKTVEQLEQEHRQAVDEGQKLEAQMRSAAASTGDLPSLQAEIAQLEAATAWGSVAAEVTSSPAATEARVKNPAPSHAVSGSATGSWIDEIHARWPYHDPSLQATISTLFAKLSGGDYTKVEWGDGRLRIQASTQQVIDPDLLSIGQRDLLVLACFLAPWLHSRTEKSREQPTPIRVGQFPLLLDEPLVSLDGTGQLACIQWLRSIGTVQQVLLATRLTVAEQQADHRITLPLAPAVKEQTGR